MSAKPFIRGERSGSSIPKTLAKGNPGCNCKLYDLIGLSEFARKPDIDILQGELVGVE